MLRYYKVARSPKKKKTLVSPCNRIRKSEQMFTYGTVAVPRDLGQEIESTVDGPITSLSIHFALMSLATYGEAGN